MTGDGSDGSTRQIVKRRAPILSLFRPLTTKYLGNHASIPTIQYSLKPHGIAAIQYHALGGCFF